ncbi:MULTISPECIES: LCP family protein [unclassified Nocardioides]|uniref:LCP family protein n=1 Tax=unclassified Nocardioides TaxID=2615069 RepID=UPI0009F0C5C8|nr:MULTISPECIES: LCP family protein [unclassified Nocardioides]GAW51175.1 cell envelope-related transcriptional attenuator [Nocardioides sp. PD653-B2]GAW56903.1 cell envelope-related transcriptional attenuator [Nocardioides sp. PD653]
MSDPAPDGAEPDTSAPKRRGKVRKRHTIGKIVLATVLVMAMATGLGTIWLYRHLNGNLNVVDVTGQLTNRPDKMEVEGPQEPLNVLVMGSDSRDCEGCNIDNLTGGGQRSDTTILFHLSADRERAYGISIPRDLIVDRPDCVDEDGTTIAGADGVMWNEAFSVGGPACTIQQVEQLTGIPMDHYVVVDFEGFKGMVDAIGGVEVCIPEPIVDPAHGINIEAGTRKIKGAEALNYVRERYVVGNGSDIGRMKRQQAFIASMAHQVVTAGTLARPDHLVGFLNAATKSLTVDDGLGSIVKLAQLGGQFQGIGLDNIQFLTIPNIPDPSDPNRLVWKQPEAKNVWDKIAHDEPLTKKLSEDVISAGNVPGSSSSSGSGNGNGGSSNEADKQALADAGLCT